MRSVLPELYNEVCPSVIGQAMIIIVYSIFSMFVYLALRPPSRRHIAFRCCRMTGGLRWLSPGKRREKSVGMPLIRVRVPLRYIGEGVYCNESDRATRLWGISCYSPLSVYVCLIARNPEAKLTILYSLYSIFVY